MNSRGRREEEKLMNCQDVRARLLDVGGVGAATGDRSAELIEHLDDCPACRALYGDGAAESGLALLQSEVLPSDLLGSLQELQMQLKEELAAEDASWLGRLASIATRDRWLIIAGTLLGSGALAVASSRVDFWLYPTWRMASTLILLLVFTLLYVRYMLRPLWSTVFSRVGLGMLLIGAAAPFALALAPQAHTLHAESLLGLGDDLWVRAAACLAWGSVLSLPLLLAWGLLGRRSSQALTTVVWSGVGCGIWGNALLQSHCPLTGPLHLILGHAPVFAVLSICGLLLRARLAGTCLADMHR